MNKLAVGGLNALMGARHPYLPTSLSLPGYAAPARSLASVLIPFFGVSGAATLAAWRWAGKARARLSTVERVYVTWLVVTAAVHVIVEGYVVTQPTFYAKSGFMDDVWKEYSKADSRYASRDAFTITMEGVTAFVVGPLCAAAAWAYAAGAPWRHVAALIASVCQLYGDVLYFATAWYEGMAATRPEPLYVWFYFAFLNSIWVVLPGAVACHTIRALVAATGKGGGAAGARAPSKRR